MEVKEELTLVKHTVALMHSTQPPQNMWVFLHKADFMEAEIGHALHIFSLNELHFVIMGQ